MDNNLYCNLCGVKNDFYFREKKMTITVRSEPIEFSGIAAVCKNCGNEIESNVIYLRNLFAAYRIYEKKHSLAGSQQLKEYEKLFMCTLQELSVLLEIQYSILKKYTAGDLMTKEDSEKIKTFLDPKKFFELLEKNKKLLTQESYNKILGKLKTYEGIAKEKNPYEAIVLKAHPSIDIERVKLSFMAVTSIVPEKSYIRLIRFMWLCDKFFYNSHAKSFTGISYIKHQSGIDIEKRTEFLSYFEFEGLIELSGTASSEDILKISITPKKSFPTIVPDENFKALQSVCTSYKSLGNDALTSFIYKFEEFRNIKNNQQIVFSKNGNV